MSGPEAGAAGRLVRLHPLCIVGVSDHFTRVKVGGTPQPADSPVIGMLFGKQEGLEVSIIDAIELSYHPNEAGQPTIEEPFLKKQCELYSAVYPERELLGWYTVAESAGPEHLAFQRDFLKFNESPLCLVMDPAPSVNSRDLPIKIFESEVRVLQDQPTLLFVSLPFQLETLQAERISMEHVAKPSSSSSTGTTPGESSFDAHVDGVDHSLGTLAERVKLIARYLEQLRDGGAELDYALVRQIGSLCDQLPTRGPPQLEAAFMRDYNDSLVVSVLTNLTKNSNAVNELSDNFFAIHTRGSKGLV